MKHSVQAVMRAQADRNARVEHNKQIEQGEQAERGVSLLQDIQVVAHRLAGNKREVTDYMQTQPEVEINQVQTNRTQTDCAEKSWVRERRLKANQAETYQPVNTGLVDTGLARSKRVIQAMSYGVRKPGDFTEYETEQEVVHPSQETAAAYENTNRRTPQKQLAQSRANIRYSPSRSYPVADSYAIFGPLASIASHPALSDIAVTCNGRVWADYGYGMKEVVPDIPLSSPQIVRDLAVQLCARLGQRLDNAHPIADASTPEGIRVHAVIAPLVAFGAAISIRFPSRTSTSLEWLGSQGMYPLSWVPVLRGLVRGRATILITGGTGTGKTTLLKTLINEIQESERIITIEEVRELGDLGHEHVVSLVAREANIEGAGEVNLSDLVKATLRMRPDRVVLGECRGQEIIDMLRAFNSGHRGGMVTLHADSISRVSARIVSLGLLAGCNSKTTNALAQGAFDVVLHLESGQRGRHIAQIGRLTTTSGELCGEIIAQWNGKSLQTDTVAWQEFVRHWVPSPQPANTDYCLIEQSEGVEHNTISMPIISQGVVPKLGT